MKLSESTISAILVILIVAAISLIACSYAPNHSSINSINLDKPYKVVIVDENEVNLVNGSDTIKLYMENATALAEEDVIFIDTKHTYHE